MNPHQPAKSGKQVAQHWRIGFCAALAALLLSPGVRAQTQAVVELGTAQSFAVLAGAGITITGPTTITGDIGTFPTPAITGIGNLTLNGVNHADDAVTQLAKIDLVTAYNDAAGRTNSTVVAGGVLGGLTLVPGLYQNDTTPDSLGLTGTLTLDAQGDPNAVWIFQAASTLIAETYSSVVLINGAQARNVFWVVGSSATLKVGSTFCGTIIALTSITLETSAVLHGRALARNGAVTLDSNTLDNPSSVGDFVWLDTNVDGLQDPGEPGLTNVTVTLYDGASNVVDTTLTGVNGYYQFTNLVPAIYFIGFTSPAGYFFTLRDQGTNDAVDSDADLTTGSTAPFPIYYGGNNQTLDAGLWAGSPSIEIVKTAGTAADGAIWYVTLNTDVVYTYAIRNGGNTYLSGVTVTDNVLGGVGSVPGIMAPGATAFLTATNLAISNNVVNIGTVVGTPCFSNGVAIGGVNNVTDNDDAVVELMAPDIAIDKTVSLDGSVPGSQMVQGTNGAALTFTFIVSNPGDVALTNVVVTDPAIGLTTNLGTLLAGESRTVSVAYVINGDLTNIASVVGYGPNDLPLNATDDAVVEMEGPGYELTKLRTIPVDRAAQVGELVTFELTVFNSGDVILTTVPLEDSYEMAYLTFVSASPVAPDDPTNDGLLNWTTIGPLAPGASTSVVVTFRAVQSSAGVEHTNSVVATPTTPPLFPPVPPQIDTALYAISVVGFSVSKTMIAPTNRTVIVGEPVTFAIQIANTGDVPLLTVSVTDRYETAYLTFTNATPAPDDNVNDGELIWTNVGPLNPGVSTTLLVRFIMTGNTLGQLHTNFVIMAASAASNQPPVPPQTNQAPYASRMTCIGNAVWVDDNLNGLPDENLAFRGLNNVRVRLFRIENNVAIFVAETWTATSGGLRGQYMFCDLTFGIYRVVVDRATVPPGLDISTTPPMVTTSLPSSEPFLEADFGFMNSRPTAVGLVWFRALREDTRVKTSWQTAIEIDNLGYNVYRSTSETGVRRRLNEGLIAGAGTGAGQTYEWWDREPGNEAVLYYWLEDVETTGQTEMHGPVLVRQTEVCSDIALPVATLTGTIFKVTGATLAKLGLSVTSTNADCLRVLINEEPVSIFVTTEGQPMSDEDWVLISTEGLTVTNLTIDLRGDPGLRMEMLFARPSRVAGDVGVTRVGPEQVARVEVGPDRVRYLISGFIENQAWLLDVTEATKPRLMIGAQWIQISGEAGLYFSHPDGGTAQCVGVGTTAVVEILPEE
jgi:uncharacterized repeat protein (TIGR01451 family)